MRSDWFFLCRQYNDVEAAPHTWSFYDAGSLHQQTGTFASRRRTLYDYIARFLFNGLGVDTNDDQSGRSTGRWLPGIPACAAKACSPSYPAVQYYQRRVAPTTCQGRPGAPCSWHPTQNGAAAKVKPAHGVFRCPICSGAQMQALHQTAHGKRALTLRLKQLLALRSTDVLQLWALVEEHLGSAALTYYQGRAGAAPRKTLQQQWKEELKLRHSVHPLPDQEGQRVWRERAREDGRMRDKKFGLAFSEQHSGRAWMSARARHFEFWAREASWFMCTDCHRLEPRPFHQSSHDKNTQLRARQKKCKHCARGIGYKAPVIDDIPGPLRDLTATALWALRPIEIDVGEYRRGDYGYRIHT
ncbi:PIF1, partial [Symbiodinium pilosum]